MFNEQDLVKQHKPRAEAIGNIILFSFAVILSRLWFLQIYKGEEFLKYSIQNQLRKEVIHAPRGMVFSRNNKMLVHNIPRFDAVVIPQYFTNRKSTLTKLAQILDMKLNTVTKILKKNSGQARYRPVIIKKNISRREVAIIETENSKMPGVSVNTFISREYEGKEIGGHLLGYISEISQTQLPKFRKRDNFEYKLGDFIGQAGLEEELDFHLRGVDGHQYMEVDARGRMKRVISKGIFGRIENSLAKPGNNIRLTVDRDMQIAAYEALEGKVGSAVAMNIETGEVLTMVSRPGFDPGQFSRGLSPEYWASLINNDKNPLRDRAIQEHYQPGSTFKTITAIAALEEGIVDENTEVVCNGSFRLGRRVSHCWKKWGHGKVNLIRSIQESCDVYYYKIATQLDIDVLAKYARALGLGVRSGIKLPRETSGLIPTKEWKLKRSGKPWVRGETLSCAIGQSFVLTTPLQLAMSYAAIANGGKIFRPILVKEIFSPKGDIIKKFTPELISKTTISDKTLKLVKEGLYKVVNSRKGTAWWHRGLGIHMAGKTGTSQVMSWSAEKLFEKCDEKPYKQRHHAVFASYAPFENPKIAVGVVVEHGCSGSSAAAPVSKAIVEAYMKKYEPEYYEKTKKEDILAYRKLLKEIKRKKLERQKEKEREKKKKLKEAVEVSDEAEVS